MNKLKLSLILIAAVWSANSCFAQVGINTTDPHSTLDINGNLSVKAITINGSGSTTLISDGVYISVNPLSADQEFQLPSPITYPGRIYILRNINNTNTAKLTTVAANFFFKGTTTFGTASLYMYDNHYRTIIVISDGSNWTVYENYIP